MTLAPGTRIGPYEVTAPLGAGGMGEVWRAVDQRLGRAVAIKVLPESVAADRERIARFAREAKLLAALRHPGIATIHAFEEFDGQTLLVMEVAEGEGLDQRIARGPLPLEEALPIARQIAEALEEAHEHGIVHRDLKPANVKVTEDGKVKLLDFGLAKALAEEPPASSGPALSATPTVEASPTVAGVIVGTAPYMAPEQVRGRSVDRRADIWAFGLVLREMLTGERLFRGPSVSDVLANVLKEPIGFEALLAETPGAVRQLLRRCLERDPRRRLRDIGEARVTLESPIQPAATESAAAPARRLRAPAALAIAAGAAGLGALAVWLARPPLASPPLRAVSFPVERLNGFHPPVLSGDGTRVLYVSARKAYVQSLTDPLAAPIEITPELTGPGLSQAFFWSPDGANVAVVMDQKLWRFPAAGGTGSVICELPESGQILGGEWGVDDQIVFAAWRGNLYRVAGGGGRPEVLLKRDPVTEVDFHYPRLLPGGRGVLFVAHRFSGEPRELDVLAGGRRSKVLDDGIALAHACYAEGRILFDHANREGIWEVPFSLSTLATTGRPRLVLADGSGASLSSDGTLLFVRGGAAPVGELVWVSADGTVGERLGVPLRGLKSPALSPDGQRVAFTSRTDQHDDLSVLDLGRATSTRLTATPDADEQFPSWMPAGDRLLFGETQNFHLVLRTIEPSGAGESREVARDKSLRGELEPDGAHLLTLVDGGSGRSVLSRAPVGADLAQTGPAAEITRDAIWWSRTAVAPQGDLVAYAALQGDRIQVFATQLVGGRRWQVSNSIGEHPCWSRSGDRLFYIAANDLMVVDVRRGPALSLGTPRRLFSLAERRLLADAFDVAADGRFLMVRQGAPARIVVVVNGRSLLAPLR